MAKISFFVNDSSIVYEGNWILNPTMVVAQSHSSSVQGSSPESTSGPPDSGEDGNSNGTESNTQSGNSLGARGSSGSSGQRSVLSAQSTFDPTASVFFEFTGSAIAVVGFIRNGSNPISANYTIDGKIPLMREETGLTLSGGIDGMGKQTLFSSPNLGEGYHSISIDAINATQDRPYTITSFAVSSGPNAMREKNTGAIVGGVLGGMILLLLLILGIFLAYRKQRAARSRLSSDSSDRIMSISSPRGSFNWLPDPFIIDRGTIHSIDPLATSRGREKTHMASSTTPSVYFSRTGGEDARSFGLDVNLGSERASNTSRTLIETPRESQAARQRDRTTTSQHGDIVRKYAEIMDAFRNKRRQNQYPRPISM